MGLYLMRGIEQILIGEQQNMKQSTDDPQTAYRCIAPVCHSIGCCDCSCAVPADIYAALGRSFAAQERERIARSFDVPPHIHGEAEDWSRAAAAQIRSDGGTKGELMDAKTLAERLRDHGWSACEQAADLIERQAAELEALRYVLHEIREEWAGAECGQPVTAQEAYAIELAHRMYRLAASAGGGNG